MAVLTLEELHEILQRKGLAFESVAEQALWINGFRTAEKMKGDQMKNQVEEVLQWFKLAVPEPTDKSKCVQIGCHFEEVSEMCESFDYSYLRESAGIAAQSWKDAAQYEDEVSIALESVNQLELLDSLCDQIVTAIGVAHMFGFDIVGALEEVNRSNFSKFVDGKPVFNEQGKIDKPNSYSPPQLDKYL